MTTKKPLKINTAAGLLQKSAGPLLQVIAFSSSFSIPSTSQRDELEAFLEAG